jgi:quercetin dioxygenase-like cupin family protein
MKVIRCDQIEGTPVETEGAVNCRMCCLIGPDDAAPSFSMRRFEVAPGGHTPRHTHAYEHEVYVLEGNGVVLEGDREHAIEAGSAVYVPPNQLHQFRNTGAGALKFLCLIPHPLRGVREVCVAACDG